MKNKKLQLFKSKLKGISPNSLLFKQYKNMLSDLSIEQKEAAIGLMLGDVSLQTQNNGKTYRIKFEWGDKSIDYVNHVKELFSEWIISEPHKKERININNNLVVTWGFQTISHEAFNYLADLFLLTSNKKRK